MEDSASSAKRRRPNFSESEILTLLKEVKKREDIILGKMDHKITDRVKEAAWREVTQAVNQVARVPRRVDESRRKFIDLRAQVKKKASRDMQQDMDSKCKNNTQSTLLVNSEMVVATVTSSIMCTVIVMWLCGVNADGQE